ncbi:hypothetical protein D9619_004272 [Psilocybe cf. subviscida]|uniref:G domain-containing protein n=1 Tax=Psilocybe cf. subviscida TaxID=2480587 RepID=A0A8H5F7M7_9AGAR|nr:hypothetical protein D9619_004272 [Psilocybe cf. subviscida]
MLRVLPTVLIWSYFLSWSALASMTGMTVAADDLDVAIAVMGATGSGKTTFINSASNSTLRTGSGLKSCTSIVQVAQPFELDGRRVTLIDTPGFDDTTKSDADILRMIAAFLATAYENGKTLAGVIYVHRISDFRMGGISTRNFKMFRQLCGESTLKNVVIVTNMWSEVSEDIGVARETELASEDLFFRPVLDKGAQMLRHGNTPASAHAIIARIIENHPLPLQIQRELVDQKMDIGDTAAGEELNKELKIQLEKHRVEMRALQEDMQEAIREKDEETRRELEIATRRLEEEMARVQNDSQKLASEYTEDKKRLEKRMQELKEAAREEAERRNVEYNEQMQNLRSQLEQNLGDKADLLRRIEEHRWQNGGGHGGGLFGVIGRAVDAIFGF